MSPETKPVVHFSGSPRTERIEAGRLGLKMSYAVASIELCQGGWDKRRRVRTDKQEISDEFPVCPFRFF